jgi:NADP-dependent aldehyde dehydrogenase
MGGATNSGSSIVSSIDARSGETVGAVASASTDEDVRALCQAAADAAAGFEALGRGGRAALLRSMAEALSADGEQIVSLADVETAIGADRLRGELTRTCFQLRHFASVLEDGGYLEATIDHAGETEMGPRPDVRRMLVPLGPVAVFGASNFPLAFSVPGGDTASALAAGCPVVIKAHPGHPGTSQRCFDAMRGAADRVGVPAGSLGLVHGERAGLALVDDPAIKAVGFTGSLRGGRLLADRAAARPDPIPFYGELGSLNPVIVTSQAAATRAADIAAGLCQSATVSAGQLCTKPGLVLVPRSPDGEQLIDALRGAFEQLTAFTPLSDKIGAAYVVGIGEREGHAGITTIGKGPVQSGRAVAPRLFLTTCASLTPQLLDECFGPTTVVATYEGPRELLATVDRLPGSLTGTIQAGPDEQVPADLLQHLTTRIGRLIWNGYPTGVSVTWAMHHGGPWPAATSSLHTSVGATAIRRFLRPFTWQNAPAAVLPKELTEAGAGIPRRIDGQLQTS